ARFHLRLHLAATVKVGSIDGHCWEHARQRAASAAAAPSACRRRRWLQADVSRSAWLFQRASCLPHHVIGNPKMEGFGRAKIHAADVRHRFLYRQRPRLLALEDPIDVTRTERGPASEIGRTGI